MTIGGYWCLLMTTILMNINGYFAIGYQWLLIVILFIVIVL